MIVLFELPKRLAIIDERLESFADVVLGASRRQCVEGTKEFLGELSVKAVKKLGRRASVVVPDEAIDPRPLPDQDWLQAQRDTSSCTPKPVRVTFYSNAIGGSQSRL